jgi:hypothetical protein
MKPVRATRRRPPRAWRAIACAISACTTVRIRCAARRSPLAAYFAAHPHRLQANVRDRLRESQQFKTESLAAHLALAGGNAVPDRGLRVTQLEPAAQGIDVLRQRMRHADAHPQQAFVCVQSLDMASEAVRGELLAWLDRRVGRIEALPLVTRAG